MPFPPKAMENIGPAVEPTDKKAPPDFLALKRHHVKKEPKRGEGSHGRKANERGK